MLNARHRRPVFQRMIELDPIDYQRVVASMKVDVIVEVCQRVVGQVRRNSSEALLIGRVAEPSDGSQNAALRLISSSGV